MGGRTIPTECEHGVTVDGGDFTESEYCAQCESSDCYNDYWATVTDSISPADSSIVDSRLKHMYYHLHLPETRRLQAVIATVKAENAKLEATITALESAAQAMVAWSYNNFDIDHCEPFDDLRALMGEQT